ncbi:hypothetical protein HK413_09250 [Mucilaginibacter sp. S1162]|uniref:Uncharacterized protein n=1 Tax=Mucilaginibacter humi TaxID=2732510 RepID=A0ABX1W275_9SPHI|nr:hypothetical protein [Mucilaginibacter humi]NNU34288.1 hypothetical protein [Mucilaginibacter humi]
MVKVLMAKNIPRPFKRFQGTHINGEMISEQSVVDLKRISRRRERKDRYRRMEKARLGSAGWNSTNIITQS